MKVVHVITGLNDGGAEAVLFRLCTYPSNVTHHIISLMGEGKYGPLLRKTGITVTCLNMPQGKVTLIGLRQLWRILRKEQPDVVQTWMYHADLLGGVIARISGVKKVFWGIRHSTLEKGKAKRSTIAIARLCAVLSPFVPKKIVCCAHKALYVHREIGYSAKKLIVISNGYDLSAFKKDDLAGQSIRTELGIPSDTFLIGKVGRYDPFKDHKNLLYALSKLSFAGLNFKCLLVGRKLTTENSELTTLIENLGLRDHVILAGQRTDIPAVMNALNLHVLSSTSEGFPNVLAEAMACGTPAISTNVGDAGEIVGDSKLLCPPRDASALSQLIISMHTEWSEEPEAWAERQNRCVQHIKSNFSIQRMVSAYENCWFTD